MATGTGIFVERKKDQTAPHAKMKFKVGSRWSLYSCHNSKEPTESVQDIKFMIPGSHQAAAATALTQKGKIILPNLVYTSRTLAASVR
jgi:hypothetical protein